MYSSYSEVLADDPRESRRCERLAFDKVLASLDTARHTGPASVPAQDALNLTDDLWTLLLRDLAQPQNALPDTLKAQLISIGLWVMREVAGLRTGLLHSFDALIDVNTAIRSGLR